jgi:Arc/MetJ family transcription regulator
MNQPASVVKARKRALKATGTTIQALANEAGVTWRMAKYWVDGQRTSARVAASFDRLVSRGVEQAS